MMDRAAKHSGLDKKVEPLKRKVANAFVPPTKVELEPAKNLANCWKRMDKIEGALTDFFEEMHSRYPLGGESDGEEEMELEPDTE